MSKVDVDESKVQSPMSKVRRSQHERGNQVGLNGNWRTLDLDIGLWTNCLDAILSRMAKKSKSHIVKVGLVQMSCDPKPEANLKKAIARIGDAAKSGRPDRLSAGALSFAILLSDRRHRTLQTRRDNSRPNY